MDHTYQHTHDFAKHLQEIVDERQYGQLLDNLCDHDNFPDMHSMPHGSRYFLVRQIADNFHTLSEGDQTKADEAMTFLLMSVPYEPLCPNERETAAEIAKILGVLKDEDSPLDKASLTSICKDVATLYCEINGLKDRPGIARFWLPENPSEEAQEYYKRARACFTTSPAGDFEEQKGLLTDARPDTVNNIFIRQSDFEQSPPLEVVGSVLHEIRHHHQDISGGVEIMAQSEWGLSKAIQSGIGKTSYPALMEERQTFAYMEWAKSGIYKKPLIPSEIETTNINIMTAGMSRKATMAMLQFNYDYNRLAAKVPFKRGGSDSVIAPSSHDNGIERPRPW